MNWKDVYNEAHRINYAKKYPQATKDGFYTSPVMPKYKTANGLTKLICNYLMWSSCHATRIASSGRLVDGIEKQPSGVLLTTKKWIPGTTRKGTSDIKAIIRGRAVDIEIKIGADKASEFQLREQALVTNAGGIYIFIKTPEQFFEFYNNLITL